MGKPKHGADSARARSCKAYKNEGRYEINKARKAERIVTGKKVKSHKQPKTWLMKWDILIRNTTRSIPVCDTNNGVQWGVVDVKASRKKNRKEKKSA